MKRLLLAIISLTLAIIMVSCSITPPKIIEDHNGDEKQNDDEKLKEVTDDSQIVIYTHSINEQYVLHHYLGAQYWSFVHH